MQPSTASQLLPPSQPKKKSHQFKALFLKSATLQSKQIGTNLCQILTPIICLFFTYLIKEIATDNLDVSQDNISIGIPLNFDYDLANMTNITDYIKINCLQWYEYQVDNPADKVFLGSKPGTFGSVSSGMLGNAKIAQRNKCKFNNSGYNNNVVVDSNVTTPFFREANGTTVNQDIANRITFINENDYKHSLDVLPDGAIKFKQANSSGLSATLQINDCRTFQYHRFNGVTGIQMRNSTDKNFTYYITVPEGQLTMVDLINTAYIKTVTNGATQVYSGIIYMPPKGDSNILVNSIINLVGSTIFPLALSLLFPVFLYSIVLQKQQRLIQMMKMNGMSMKNYWLVSFIFNLILSLLTNTIFYLFGFFLVKNSFFTDTPFIIMFVVLLGWILAQIGMATLFQTVLSNSRSANIIGYLLSIWTSLIAASLNVGVYQYPTQIPYGLRMYAPFGFTRIFYLMLTKCSGNECITSFNQMPQEMIDEIMYLYICFLVFQLVGMYLHEIIPQEYGVARPLLFPFQFLKNLCKNKREDYESIEQDKDLRKYVTEEDEDQDSRHERVEVSRFQDYFSKYPLVCNNLRKIYKKQGRDKPFAAVGSLNLIIEQNQIFGLLGPNGAGKTTLISLITGMFEPNNGNAWVGGYSIRDQIQKVHLEMGVCPQFDLLWPELTVEEHLFFYARLKGVNRSEERKMVDDAITQVNLEKFAKFKTTQLSGGMKRRLSVAISLVGTPKIVFLDEPTTGLDPDNRRQLWSVLAKCREKRAMFLTTHMMDEADTLCNRIGIITNGILRTVGNQIKLRKRYGGGYRLDINLMRDEPRLRQSMIMRGEGQGEEQINDSENMMTEEMQQEFQERQMRQDQRREASMKEKSDKLMKFLAKNFQQSRLIKVFNGNFIYQLGTNVMVSEVFETLEKHRTQLSIAHWGVLNSSLEDVFMAVVHRFDKEQRLAEEKAEVQIERVDSMPESDGSYLKKNESVMST